MKRTSVDGYGEGTAKQFLPYSVLLLAFNSLLGAELRRASRSKFRTEEHSLRELVLLGLATHKLSRIITKDAVTAPIRAPFSRRRESLGYGEVLDEPRGHGIRSIIGELLTCNYCADPWVALTLLYGMRFFPKPTRLALFFFSAVTVADSAHVVYETVRTRENVLTLREESLEKKTA